MNIIKESSITLIYCAGNYTQLVDQLLGKAFSKNGKHYRFSNLMHVR